jgi:hypothetical protein
MNPWLGPDWDRGYKAGRAEGRKEQLADDLKAIVFYADKIGLTIDQVSRIQELFAEENGWQK